jgi:signal transduction histidine kinase
MAWRYLAVGALLTLGYVLALRVGVLSIPAAEIILYIGLGVSTAAAIVVGARRWRPRPALAWHLFAVGTLALVLADLVFVLTQEPPPSGGAFPSVADAMYLLSYSFMVGGLLLIIRRRGPGSHRASLVEALLVVTAVGLLAWALLVTPIARHHGIGPLASLVGMVYPLLDLLLLTAAVKLALDGGRRTPAFWLLGAGLICVLATDTAFGVQQLWNGYRPGGVLDLGWMAWYACWGAAALHPSMVELSEPATAPHEQRLGRGRLWLLAVASLLAPALATGEAALGWPVDVPALVLGSVVLSLLVLARVAGLAAQVAGQASEHKHLLDRVVQATEEERVRVAGNLHDGPIQRLNSLGYMVELARTRFDRGEVAASQELLGALEEGIFNEVAALRRVMAELRPPVLDDFGLPAALRDYAAGFQERSGVECIVLARPGMRLDPPLETVLYRVAQEALANVAKHADAKQAMVSLSVQDGLARLAVRDDGAGFDVARTVRRIGLQHFGLSSMRERVEMVGGSFQIRSNPGEGTTVTAVLAVH